MRVAIAAQACILVLELGEEWYEGWSDIIVYPAQFAPEREFVDEAGVVAPHAGSDGGRSVAGRARHPLV